MEDLGENTTVLSSLRSLNNFIAQRVDGGAGLEAPTSAPGSLQMQYQQSMQVGVVSEEGSLGEGTCPQVGWFSLPIPRVRE